MKLFKKTLLLSATAVLTIGLGLAAQQVINVGSSPNDHTGDTLRAALVKANDNFTEVYGKFPASLANGGTGGTSAATARTALGLAIGTDVQAWDADLDTWATKTAPAGTIADISSVQTLTNKSISGGQITSTVANATLAATATALAANGANCSANNAPLGVDASGAVEGCFAPYVPGGTDVAVADGGTGSSTASAARTALAVLGLADANTLTNALPITVSSTEPREMLSESDQGSDLKAWDWDLNAGVLTGRTRTDADGAGKNWVAVTRGATTAISDITFGNATDNPTINFTSNLVTSSNDFQSNGWLITSAPTPLLKFIETDQGTNLKRWSMSSAAAVWKFSTITDADATGKDIWTVTRGTTTAVSSMSFGNATDNPSFTFNGSGTVTLGTGTTQSNGSFRNSSVLPEFRMIESDQGTDLKNWSLQANGAVLKFMTQSDAGSAGNDFLSVVRGATTAVTSVSFGNATNNNTTSFLGSGSVTLGGAYISGGTKFTASGCSNSATVGGATAGKYASGTTGTCTVVITLPTAPNGWSCHAADLTTPANFISQSASSTTSCTVTGTTVSGDVVNFMAIGF